MNNSVLSHVRVSYIMGVLCGNVVRQSSKLPHHTNRLQNLGSSNTRIDLTAVNWIVIVSRSYITIWNHLETIDTLGQNNIYLIRSSPGPLAIALIVHAATSGPRSTIP